MLTNHFIPNMSNKNDGLEMMFLWSSGLLHLNKKLQAGIFSVSYGSH